MTDPNERLFWNRCKLGRYHTRDSVAATMFSQLMYELARATFADEPGEVQFKTC